MRWFSTMHSMQDSDTGRLNEGSARELSSLDAVLDACVLFPVVLCDTLLRIAERGIYRPHWSDEILGEVERSLVRSGKVAAPFAGRRVSRMARTFPDSAVRGYTPLVPAMTNDINDRHVLAAAVVAGARIIVTFNTHDFPLAALEPFDIEAQTPDQFLLSLLRRHTGQIAEVIAEQAAALSRPPLTVAMVLDRLALHAPAFVAQMRSELTLN